MFCSECGAEVKDEAEFCTKCGTKVEQQQIESINIEDGETIDSNEGLLKRKSENIFPKKKIAVIVGIILLFGVGFGIFLICSGSPINNVSRGIYKEAMDDVNYYQCDSFYKAVKDTGMDEEKTPALLDEIKNKENKLLESCSNDDERTFVKKAYRVAQTWYTADVAMCLSEIVKQVKPDGDFTDLENEVSKLVGVAENGYKTLESAKSIEELNGIE
ncbi:MAG: zinc-ribbon domain-containing protein [Bacillota bacterium]|nr:zinc-ribbon domain-containing protein [Bacillota bacterium]